MTFTYMYSPVISLQVALVLFPSVDEFEEKLLKALKEDLPTTNPLETSVLIEERRLKVSLTGRTWTVSIVRDLVCCCNSFSITMDGATQPHPPLAIWTNYHQQLDQFQLQNL